MNVWNVCDLLLGTVGMLYITIREQKKCIRSRKSKIVGCVIAGIAYMSIQMVCFTPDAWNFCVRVGINVLILGILHKWLYQGELLEAVCKGLIIYQIYTAILVLCLAFSYGTRLLLHTNENSLYIYLYVYQIIGIRLLSIIIHRVDIEKVVKQKIIQCVILILSVIILLALVWVLKLAKTSLEYLNSIGYLLVIICVILGAIWLYDKQNELKIKKRLEEDNMLLASRVHKTKEIIPAVAEELKEISKELGENREERICNLAEEMKSLQKTYVQDYSTSYTQSYHTGYRLLDRQLEGYERETAEKGIGCLIMLKDKPSRLSKEIGMSQGEIQQVVGDLMRNAIRAVESSEEKEGRILFCFGYVPGNGTYVLEVYDNGTAFPREILDHLGTRGMTTAGTGHGLADVRETVEKYGGRLEVEELAEDIYEKVVRVIIKAGKEAR